jgi:hypothetical protein
MNGFLHQGIGLLKTLNALLFFLWPSLSWWWREKAFALEGGKEISEALTN